MTREDSGHFEKWKKCLLINIGKIDFVVGKKVQIDLITKVCSEHSQHFRGRLKNFVQYVSN